MGTSRAWYKVASASSSLFCSHSMSIRLAATVLIMAGCAFSLVRYCNTCLCRRSPCCLVLPSHSMVKACLGLHHSNGRAGLGLP